jgi:signal peptidase II
MSRRILELHRFLLLILLMLGCIGCDQYTKSIATESLSGAPPISLLGDVVRIQYVQNPGGFLGLGDQLPEPIAFWVFTIFAGLLVSGLLAVLLLRRNMDRLSFLSLGLIAAGGVGNLIDRVLHDGLVTDFINLGIGPLRTGIFNVADVAIAGGALALALLSSQASERGEEQTQTPDL